MGRRKHTHTASSAIASVTEPHADVLPVSSEEYQKTVTKIERIVIVAEGSLKKDGKYALSYLPFQFDNEAMATGTADEIDNLKVRSEQGLNPIDSILHHPSPDLSSVILSLPKASAYPV